MLKSTEPRTAAQRDLMEEVEGRKNCAVHWFGEQWCTCVTFDYTHSVLPGYLRFNLKNCRNKHPQNDARRTAASIAEVDGAV